MMRAFRTPDDTARSKFEVEISMPKLTDVDATRMRLVQAAWRVIATEGIQAASLRRVAREADCTTGLITHYFADKNDLVTSAYRQVLNTMLLDATEAIAAEDHLAEKILAAIEAIEPGRPALKEFTVVLINFWAAAAFNPTFAEYCKQDYRRWWGLLRTVIQSGVDKEELKKDVNVDMLVDLLTLVSDGLGVGMTLTPGHYPKHYRAAIVRQILEPHLRK
jgi:AcrR family transcriptional regulator